MGRREIPNALLATALLCSCTVSATSDDAASIEQLSEAVRAVERERLSKLGLAALDRFQDTWNTRVVPTWSRSLHFPHVRPSAGAFALHPEPADYIRASEGVFKRVIAAGWHRSQWLERDVLHVSADKMHIAGRYQRLREDGSELTSQQVTYIVTRQGENWGIQSRFGTGFETGDQAAAAEPARAAAEAYFEAFNSMDLEAWADTMHYPQVRLSLSGLDYWASREEFLQGSEPGRLRTWYETRLDEVVPYQVGVNGVNVRVRYSRLNRHGETLSSYDAVYLITDRDGRSAVQARSSYAP